MSGGRFGRAGARVVLEECLRGPEVSFFVLTDGLTAMPLGTAQDHKRAYDGDAGPNTGGMGAFSPSPLVDPALHARIVVSVVEPVLRGMRDEGHAYRGFLYCGLMLTDRGPMVIEFNARLGDPETQVLLPLDEPLLPLLQAVASRQLPSRSVRMASRRRVGVVIASGGYPDAFESGELITGLNDAAALDGVRVFHAGTTLIDGRIVSAGGRVLTVVGEGDTFEAAIQRAYAGVDCIRFDGAYARRDIGKRALGT
jgi:phosphoribosylamine--glycine ligase